MRPPMPAFELLRKDKQDVVKRLMVKAATTKLKEIDTFIESLLKFKQDHDVEAKYLPAGHLIEQFILSVVHIHGYENLQEHLSDELKGVRVTQGHLEGLTKL